MGHVALPKVLTRQRIGKRGTRHTDPAQRFGNGHQRQTEFLNACHQGSVRTGGIIGSPGRG